MNNLRQNLNRPLIGLLFALALCLPGWAWAEIPATPVMTLYDFSGPIDTPYYTVESFERGNMIPAGSLAQGSSVVPCLVIRNGAPLTDAGGTPFVGFEIVVDSKTATRADADKFRAAVAARNSMTVPNNHCDAGVKYVIDVRRLYKIDKPPFFDPPRAGGARKTDDAADGLDEIVRAFHNSAQCEEANSSLIGRRGSLELAWDRFVSANRNRWPAENLARARHLDYTMRTALFEGDLDRGCSAYGACERNIIALSIRNRGRESCSRGQGCGYSGDFQGVSSKISQYNIWDEFITQISGLTSCFLRSDLSEDRGPAGAGEGRDFNADYYKKIRRMYEQNEADVERILFGDESDLAHVFPDTPLSALKGLRHYYHPPAMGKCFPEDPRVEYITGAVAKRGDDFALIANTRVEVEGRVDGGYLFKKFNLEPSRDRDITSVVDSYPGFVLDAKKVSLKSSSGCTPYGIPRGCHFKEIGRYRKMPSWIGSGGSIAIRCKLRDRGEACTGTEDTKAVTVGGACDTKMQPVTGVR